MSSILTKIQDFIQANTLLNKESLYLVALSGGADSVCLLLMMKSLGYRIEAIHCNFHLREEESDRDENFCKALCKREKVPFHLVHFDTRSYAELHKVSIEMAARDLRYNYFEQLRCDLEAEAILVAHHKDDSVETLLMNLVRGTGIHGLQGIKPRNGRILRPLLCISRSDIEDYLKTFNQDYVTDSTNLIDDVVRNKIRLNVIPLLKTINPSVSENIAHTALRMVEAGAVYDNAISCAAAYVMGTDTDKDCIRTPMKDGERIRSGERAVANANKPVTIDTEKLKEYAYAESILFHILQPMGFNPSQIEEMARADYDQPGKRWDSSEYTLAVDRKTLLIRKRQCDVKKIFRFPETGTYVIKETEERTLSNGEEHIETHTEKISLKEVVIDSVFKISKESDCVCLDAEKVVFPLTMRHTEQGDRFQPFGMKGTKLVSDYLTDRKKTVFDKEDQLVLTDAKGRVIWLVGERPDAKACITKDSVKSIVIRYYR